MEQNYLDHNPDHNLDCNLDHNPKYIPIYTGHSLNNTTKYITLLFNVESFTPYKRTKINPDTGSR